MILSKYTLKNVDTRTVIVPENSIFELPEKVLQFGTGVLLRGLPDYFIDKANRNNIFNGRIVVVKSTSSGDTVDFGKQDGLYTVCVRGIEDGKLIEENIINSSISRVLSANDEWEKVLECAHDSNFEVIISNTTEVGIQLVQEDIRHHPPRSFPGKLLAFLLERFEAFKGSPNSGMVIVPTELIPDNGRKLESIVLELAHLNGLDEAFIDWLENHNFFCSSLVDRIVPGRPAEATLRNLERELGYTDNLLTMSEVYRLWAIEGDQHVRDVLSFAQVDEGVVIVPDINIYRELKLRLLNGTHSLACGVAFLAGCKTVKEAMEDKHLFNYISRVMQDEISPSIPYRIDDATASEFCAKVLDRFRNPHIDHQWLSITLNYSSKLKMRCVPVLQKHYQQFESVPELIALGFAAYLVFTRPMTRKGEQYFGSFQGTSYLIQDDQAPVFYRRWSALTPTALVRETLSDSEYWNADLTQFPGFYESVLEKLNLLLEHGMADILEQSLERLKVQA